MFEDSMIIRVYYAETDALGIVHHANYIKYLERARTEALRRQGVDLPALSRHYGVQFTVSQLDIKYVGSARLDDELEVKTRISKVGGASLHYEQAVYLAHKEQLLCKAKLRIACIDSNLKPAALPGVLKEELYV